MSQDLLLGNSYFCDLCPRLRRAKPRAMGCDWIDCYWACAECFKIYCGKLIAAGGNVYVTRS